MRSLGVFSNGGYADFLMVPHPRYLFDIGGGAERLDVPAKSGDPVIFPALHLRQLRLGDFDPLRQLSLGEAGRLPPTILLTTFDDDAVLSALEKVVGKEREHA